jgi:hypothetical protein
MYRIYWIISIVLLSQFSVAATVETEGESLLKCRTRGDSYTAILELKDETKGNLRIKDPPPFDRITNCKLTKSWSSGDLIKTIEFKRGICSPERPWEKSDLFPGVMVIMDTSTGKMKVKLQYRKVGGLEPCLFFQ